MTVALYRGDWLTRADQSRSGDLSGEDAITDVQFVPGATAQVPSRGDASADQGHRERADDAVAVLEHAVDHRDRTVVHHRSEEHHV